MSETMSKEDRELDRNAKIRNAFIDELTKEGVVPNDVKEQATLLKALKDSDAVQLALKRIDTDKDIADKNAESAALIASVLTDIQPQLEINNNVIDSNVTIPVLSTDIPDPELVPGETDIAPRQLTHSEFQELATTIEDKEI